MPIIKLTHTDGIEVFYINSKYISLITIIPSGTKVYIKGRNYCEIVKETPEEIQNIINLTKALNKMKVNDMMKSRLPKKVNQDQLPSDLRRE